MELINKADVEKILSNLWKQDDGHNSEHRICYNKALQEVQCELDTLEVKEVDKENKDMNEKIRQYLLLLVKPLWEDTLDNVGLKKDDIIAWIEKKGE
jgi:hypothetical protein